MSVTIQINDKLRRILSCSKLEISKNFVNQNEILHYDILIAIVWIVNYYFCEIMIEIKINVNNSLLISDFRHKKNLNYFIHISKRLSSSSKISTFMSFKLRSIITGA
jgi:hypothetical protein